MSQADTLQQVSMTEDFLPAALEQREAGSVSTMLPLLPFPSKKKRKTGKEKPPAATLREDPLPSPPRVWGTNPAGPHHGWIPGSKVLGHPFLPLAGSEGWCADPLELGAALRAPPILGMGVTELHSAVLPLPRRAGGSLCFHKDTEIGEKREGGEIKRAGEHDEKKKKKTWEGGSRNSTRRRCWRVGNKPHGFHVSSAGLEPALLASPRYAVGGFKNLFIFLLAGGGGRIAESIAPRAVPSIRALRGWRAAIAGRRAPPPRRSPQAPAAPGSSPRSRCRPGDGRG